MRFIDQVRTRITLRSLKKTAAGGVLCLIALQQSPQLSAGEEVASDTAKRPAIVIRPANFDPANELAYTLRHGEVEPGKLADGKKWNQPAEDLRAAVSGETPTPTAPAEGAAPDSAASGIPVAPKMTYAQAYAQVPFSRSEYEANPGYRHDAALELMFGVLRPITVVRQTTPYFSRYPDMFRHPRTVYPYQNNNGNGWSNVNIYRNTSLIAY